MEGLTEKAAELIGLSAAIKQKMQHDKELHNAIVQCVSLWVSALKSGGKILFCGNGGSAADAQHIAAELSGRFYLDREPLFAEALHVNTSYLTAVANDYGYDEVFARLVRAKGRSGDVLVGLSTSGKSPNVIRAMEAAKTIGMRTIGMCGESPGKFSGIADVLLKVPSGDTPRIQEGHILIGHILCQLTEEELF
ncbi:MAG: SIS domain-containing protein [Salibacteraceae bacterium]